MVKYFSIILFTLCANTCFSQKILILKNTLTAPGEKHVYVSQDVFDSALVYSPSVLKGSADKVFIIPVEIDSITICGIDEGFDATFGKTITHKPPVYKIKHIASFPADTIVISGLAFRNYFHRRMLTATTSDYRADSTGRDKPEDIPENESAKFPDSIPMPMVVVSGSHAGARMRLTRSEGSSDSFTMTDMVSMRYTYQTLFFTIEIDLEEK